MPTPLVVANWKMYKTLEEVQSFFKEFIPKVKDVKDREVVVAPPAVFLQESAKLVQGTNVKLCCQDFHTELQGAFTGEISLVMIKDFVEYVLVGHSERRQHNNETDEDVNKKLLLAMSEGFKPILCVGEKLEHRQFGDTNKVIEQQLKAALHGAPKDKISALAVAYEPVWAIGTGIHATPEQGREVQEFIRSILEKEYGEQAKQIRVLYGGSVAPEDIAEIMGKQHVDGVLVGGASLNTDAFSSIVHF